MDYELIFTKLYEIVISLIENVNSIWDFITTPFNIRFFGLDIITITPLAIIGGTAIVTLLGFALIKAFVPGA